MEAWGVTTEEWNKWLEFGYEFAVENAFRRLVVIAANGKRMDALSEVDWLQNQKDGLDPLISDKAAIRRFLWKTSQERWRAGGEQGKWI
jgi:hypothetical protein